MDQEANGRTPGVVGVTGSIAAFKAAALVSQLVQRDYDVTVILTESATRMVTPATFQALTRGPVLVDLWASVEANPMGHLESTDHTRAFVVAPATADFIGKVACGIADDALTTSILACTAPVLIAPAMNPRMWANPIVQRNVKSLEDVGYEFLGPVEGRLAEGVTGMGRMMEPEEILAAVERVAGA